MDPGFLGVEVSPRKVGLVPGIQGLEISWSRIWLDQGFLGVEVSRRKVGLVPGIQLPINGHNIRVICAKMTHNVMVGY